MYNHKTTDETLFEQGVLQICTSCGAAVAVSSFGGVNGICPYCNSILR